MRLITFALTVMATSATAQNLTIQFSDGAPKDRIMLTNAGCPLADAVITLDLEESQGRLIFDTTSQGAGVEVYQPVEITSGSATIAPVNDGDKILQILVKSLATGEKLSLTADIDDTLDASRQITVSGSEMAGASVSLVLNDRVLTGIFGTDGAASIGASVPKSTCMPS
jgi:hypothetical protein